MVCVKGDDGGAMLCLTAGRCRHHRPRANVPPSHRSRASGLCCRTCVCLLRHAPPPIVANQLRPVPRGAPSLTVTPFRAQPAPPNPVLPLTHSFPPPHPTTTTTLSLSIPPALSLSLARTCSLPLPLRVPLVLTHPRRASRRARLRQSESTHRAPFVRSVSYTRVAPFFFDPFTTLHRVVP